MNNLQEVMDQTLLCNRVIFTHVDVRELLTLNPFSHVYQFDDGFPPELLTVIGTIFNRSHYTKYFISYKTLKVLVKHGFQLEFIDQEMVSMAGSQSKKTVYFYKRINAFPELPADPLVVLFPKREGYDEEEENFICDNFLIESIEVAVGPVRGLQKHTKNIVDEFNCSDRPKRNRKNA
jgi:hypothetical protein